jgi:phosphoribosylamine--glycine ligase
MKILIVGSGGREHALAWKLAHDTVRPEIFCAPGNAGTAALGENLPIQSDDLTALSDWARRARPDLTVIGPEAPLCAGLVDLLQADGLRVFGPIKAAARMEGSKIFAKEILTAAGVPTAEAESFDDVAAAKAYIRDKQLPLVIKADGLAAGKGVLICQTNAEAEAALEAIMVRNEFGVAGRQILIEECLTGNEISVLALVDGQRALLLPPAQDHKRIGDGDTGKNTGGMGAYSPAPWDTPDFRTMVLDTVFKPTLRELTRRGIEYRGVLYAGLMLTDSGPKVLEFNCRFGDPETQVILPRLQSDLFPALTACCDGALDDSLLIVNPAACACVVLAAGGYPDQYRKGDRITGLEAAAALPDTVVFHAGVKLEDGCPVTNGGRVLNVSALGADLPAAVANAYKAARLIKFDGVYMRKDIGARGLNVG